MIKQVKVEKPPTLKILSQHDSSFMGPLVATDLYFYIARLAAWLNLSCVYRARNAHTHGPIHCVMRGRCNRNFRCHPEIKDTGRSRTRQPTALIEHLRKEIQKNRIISWPLGQDLITLDGLLGARCKF
jgi:hypothetical protein